MNKEAIYHAGDGLGRIAVVLLILLGTTVAVRMAFDQYPSLAEAEPALGLVINGLFVVAMAWAIVPLVVGVYTAYQSYVTGSHEGGENG